MGKKKHDIHKCFRDEQLKEGNKSLKKRICNFCSWSTFPNATRQLKHISSCMSCPAEVKRNFRHHKKFIEKSSISK